MCTAYLHGNFGLFVLNPNACTGKTSEASVISINTMNTYDVVETLYASERV